MAMAELVECSLCSKKGVERDRLRTCGNLFPEEPYMQSSIDSLMVHGMRGGGLFPHQKSLGNLSSRVVQGF